MTWVLGADDRPTTGHVAAEIVRSDPGFRLVDAPDLADSTGVAVCTGDARRLAPLLRSAREADVDVVVVAAGGATVDPWSVLDGGGCDVLEWAGDSGPVLARVRRLREVARLAQTAAESQGMIGRSQALRGALHDLVTAAHYGRGPILILGETGTGKEIAARVAHQVGRAGRRGHLVVVDCGSILPTLYGSELFGHERGAFTGAVGARTGACAAADGGTLFLDEVGELALDLQPALLRLIQEGMYKRVGSDTWQRSSFRLICATNRALEAEVESGRFRADLYHRIAACRVTMPPLAHRREDIPLLFRTFLAGAAGVMGTPDGRAAGPEPELTPAVEQALLGRAYPGNLRDLRQLATRVATRHVGVGPVTPGDLPPADRPSAVGPSAGLRAVSSAAERLDAAVRDRVREGGALKELRERVADIAVAAALDEFDGNVRAAAARLGVTDRALHLRLAHHRAASA
jgi:transcriptional regulator with GAF, ATPase, and Fis domain